MADENHDKLSSWKINMLWNEHHAVRKSHDATHKENVLTWCISGMYHVIGLKQTRGIKNVALKAAKKFEGVAVYWEE